MGKYTASSKTWELNSGHSILCLPKAKNDRRLTSESSSSHVQHRAKAANLRGGGPETRKCNGRVYAELHCAYKNCRFGNRRFCYCG